MVKTSPSTAGTAGWIPGWGAKILHASGPKSQNIKQKQYCKINEDFKNGPHPGGSPDYSGSCGALKRKEQDKHEGSGNSATEKTRLLGTFLPAVTIVVLWRPVPLLSYERKGICPTLLLTHIQNVYVPHPISK